MLGFSLLQHPVGLLRHQLPAGMTSSRDLATLPHGMPVHLPGLVVCRQRPETAKGITFMLLEDEWGLVNVIVYPDLYARQRLEVRSTPFLIVEGRLQRTQNNLTIIARNLRPIKPSAIDDGRPRGDHQPDDRREEADVRVLSFRADAGAVNPSSHNYR